MNHSIIIGGTKGVGRELAALWASEGDHVTVVGRSPATFPEHSGTGEIHGLAGDLEDPKSVLAALIEQIDRLGKWSRMAFLQRYRGDGDKFEGEWRVAVLATRILIEGLVDYAIPNVGKAICIVASNATAFVARNQSAGYHVSKAALKQLMKCYAVQYGPLNIRCNMVSPCTFVKEESATYYSQQTDLNQLYSQIVPLGRMGTAREVAELTHYLCSKHASFVTGQEVFADGGLSLMLQDSLAREIAKI